MSCEFVLRSAADTAHAFVIRDWGSNFGNFFDDGDIPGSNGFRDYLRQAVKTVTSVVNDLFHFGIRAVLRAKQRGHQMHAATH